MEGNTCIVYIRIVIAVYFVEYGYYYAPTSGYYINVLKFV